jgi:membrane protein DedA with SNARE-associated domain
MSPQFLDQLAYLQQLSYFGIFLVVMAAGHVIPIPESITLILIGYVSVYKDVHLGLVLFFAFLGTMGIDIFMYAISRKGNVLASRIARKIDQKHFDKYLNAQEKHLFWLVFFSHFIPGWRFANPVILGITKMPWKKFLSYSVIASCIHTPFYIFLGFFLHKNVVPVINAVESGGKILLYIVLAGVLIGIIHIVLEKRKNVYNRTTNKNIENAKE